MTAQTRPETEVRLRLSATQRAFVEDEHRYTLLLGGVGAGKSYAGAVKALARFAASTRPSLGLVVSPTYPMLKDATWRTALDVWKPLISRVVENTMRIVLVTGDEVIFRSSDDPDRLRGPNASWAWIDEAALCHPETWPITIGRLRQFGEVGTAWLTTTPKGMNWLYDVFVTQATDETAVHRAATWANPFVDSRFVQTLRSQYGGEFARQEIEAEFIADQAGTLIEWRHLEAAQRRPAAYDGAAGPVIAGLDVAGPGEDESVLVVRQGPAILDVRAFGDADARGPVLAALRAWRHRGLVRVNVDTAGLGHYVARHLDDAGLRVRDINVGESPTTDDARERYANLKGELYWALRERFADGDISGLTDRTMLAQLAGLRYQHDNRGRVKIESKDDAVKRGQKSPDRAEALMLAFAPDDPRAARAALYGLKTGGAR
jgi:phage terminase large subunit-like protein